MNRLFILLITCILTACVNIPTRPSILALPGSGKSFDQFRSDEYECWKYAYEQVRGIIPQKTFRASDAESASDGTGLDTATDADKGGGQGTTKSSATRSSYINQQQQYDFSYIQCMYAKGHRVPVPVNITNDPSASSDADQKNLTPPVNHE